MALVPTKMPRHRCCAAARPGDAEGVPQPDTGSGQGWGAPKCLCEGERLRLESQGRGSVP